MSSRPKAGRGVFYSRDSGGEHETTPAEYVLWAARRAADLKVTFTGTPVQIEGVIRNRQFKRDDLFFDYCVKGNIFQRDGLDALLAEVREDATISHVFIPRRDRLVRPEDAMEGVELESRLLYAGVSVVYMKGVIAPQKRGRRELGETISALVDFDHAGKERFELAQKIRT